MCPSAGFLFPAIDGRRSLEDIPLPRVHPIDIDRLVDGDGDPLATIPDDRDRRRQQGRRWSGAPNPTAPRPARPRARADGRESFKCGRCRAFVGPTVSGGRHRNHCPLCLTSRHVDARRPGDRASPCRRLMAPVGTFFRPRGEQVVVHRCNGCDVERRCRVAADDNPLALLRLPLVPLRGGNARPEADEAIA